MKTCHLDSEFTARIIMSGSWYISVMSLEFRSRVKYWPHRLYSLDILFPFRDYLSLKSPDTNVCNSSLGIPALNLSPLGVVQMNMITGWTLTVSNLFLFPLFALIKDIPPVHLEPVPGGKTDDCLQFSSDGYLHFKHVYTFLLSLDVEKKKTF